MTMPRPDVLEVLVAARALIADPKHWRTGDFEGLNDAGEPCYCALGAVRAAGGSRYGVRDAAENALWRATPSRFVGPAQFNDEEGHANVLWLFDCAIAMEAGEEMAA